MIQVDQHQDCLDFNAEFTSKGIVFAFTRKFDTCDDPFDYLLEDGTTHVIWAHGQGPLYDVNNLNIDRITNKNRHLRLLAIGALFFGMRSCEYLQVQQANEKQTKLLKLTYLLLQVFFAIFGRIRRYVLYGDLTPVYTCGVSTI